MVKISASKTHSIGFQMYISPPLVFILSQHSRDEELIKSFIKYFQCGRVEYRKNGVIEYIVSKFGDITIVKYPIEGVKSQDFFCKVAEMMYNKEHLTFQGLNQIRIIKAAMNKKSTLLSN